MCGNHMSIHIPEGKKPMAKLEYKHELKTNCKSEINEYKSESIVKNPDENAHKADHINKFEETPENAETIAEICETVTPTDSEFASTSISLEDYWDQILEALEMIPCRPKSYPQEHSKRGSFTMTRSFTADAAYLRYMHEEFLKQTPPKQDNWTDDFKLIRELSENMENLRLMTGIYTPFKNPSTDTIYSEDSSDDTPSFIDRIKEDLDLAINVNLSKNSETQETEGIQMNQNLCCLNKEDFIKIDYNSTEISQAQKLGLSYVYMEESLEKVKISNEVLLRDVDRQNKLLEDDEDIEDDLEDEIKAMQFKSNSNSQGLPSIKTKAINIDWRTHSFDGNRTITIDSFESNFEIHENACLQTIYDSIDDLQNWQITSFSKCLPEINQDEDLIKPGSPKSSDSGNFDDAKSDYQPTKEEMKAPLSISDDVINIKVSNENTKEEMKASLSISDDVINIKVSN